MDMLSFESSNSSKPLDLNGYISMQPPVPAVSSTHSEVKIKAFEEFVEEPLNSESTSSSCWSLKFYQPYFDVKTSTVLERLQKVLVPGGDFFEQERPDMYGPFWIVTTLVCAVTMVANEVEDQKGYHVSLLVWTAGVLYGLGIGVPLATYCILRSHSSYFKFVRLLSLYCYSYLPFIPTTLLSVFLAWGWSLAAVCLAVLWSLVFLVKQGLVAVEGLESSQRGLLSAIVLGGHVSLGFFLNWYLVGKKI